MRQPIVVTRQPIGMTNIARHRVPARLRARKVHQRVTNTQRSPGFPGGIPAHTPPDIGEE
jgi:hypothetical protein